MKSRIQQPYLPNDLPITDLNFRRLLPLIGRANAALARYDGLLSSIPNPAVMLSPLTTQEAVLSSRIEGTQATLEEVLEQEAGLLKKGEKYNDIQEISNYRRALLKAKHHLENYPIRLGFVRELHRILLDSVRGQDKTPGEFRRDQNWIGPPGASLEQASFIPPAPFQLPDHLQAWERYLDENDDDFLLQSAVVHAQFELLHPFKDGNGRIGRILIPLFLYQKRVLSEPMFYLSEYMENHRDKYYQRLKNISADDDWDGWIAFFLQAITEQATRNGERVAQIKTLYDDMKITIQKLTHSQFSGQLLDAVFSRPIFRTTDLIKQLNQEYEIHKKTTSALLKSLKEAGILREIFPARGSRPATLCFPDLLNLAEGRKIF